MIRRFLDAQQIQHLTSYLEAYHQHPRIQPMSEHTTLLIHCYTKQQNDQALHVFLGLHKTWKGGEGKEEQEGQEGHQGRIDIKTAVRALREANYADEALELSRREGDHPTYLQILLEEEQDDTPYEKACEALLYIRELSFIEAETTLLAHAKDLVKSAAKETTALLMDICSPTGTCWQRSTKSTTGSTGGEEERICSNPEAYLPAFVDYTDRENKFSHHLELRTFLWHVVSTGAATVKVWNTLLELCLHEATTATATATSTASSTSTSTTTTAAAATEEVMRILKDPTAKYDTDQALVLVQRQHFSKGQLYLYEKRKMYHMIIQHYIDNGNHRSILTTGRKYGDRDPNLWRKILAYYAGMNSEETTECEPYIIQSLTHISKHQTLSPMVIFNIPFTIHISARFFF